MLGQFSLPTDTCVIQLFGAAAGFVTTFAAVASGEHDLFLIPKDFPDDTEARTRLTQTIQDTVGRMVAGHTEPPHGVIVVAEGVRTGGAEQGRDEALRDIVSIVRHALAKRAAEGNRRARARAEQLLRSLLTNQPRHLIRAIPPAPTDQILCRRLARMAVDSAMAGYHDIIVSHLLTEYVMVPLALVVGTPFRDMKRLPPNGTLVSMARPSPWPRPQP